MTNLKGTKQANKSLKIKNLSKVQNKKQQTNTFVNEKNLNDEQLLNLIKQLKKQKFDLLNKRKKKKNEYELFKQQLRNINPDFSGNNIHSISVTFSVSGSSSSCSFSEDEPDLTSQDFDLLLKITPKEEKENQSNFKSDSETESESESDKNKKNTKNKKNNKNKKNTKNKKNIKNKKSIKNKKNNKNKKNKEDKKNIKNKKNIRNKKKKKTKKVNNDRSLSSSEFSSEFFSSSSEEQLAMINLPYSQLDFFLKEGSIEVYPNFSKNYLNEKIVPTITNEILKIDKAILSQGSFSEENDSTPRGNYYAEPFFIINIWDGWKNIKKSLITKVDQRTIRRSTIKFQNTRKKTVNKKIESKPLTKTNRIGEEKGRKKEKEKKKKKAKEKGKENGKKNKIIIEMESSNEIEIEIEKERERGRKREKGKGKGKEKEKGKGRGRGRERGSKSGSEQNENSINKEKESRSNRNSIIDQEVSKTRSKNIQQYLNKIQRHFERSYLLSEKWARVGISYHTVDVDNTGNGLFRVGRLWFEKDQIVISIGGVGKIFHAKYKKKNSIHILVDSHKTSRFKILNSNLTGVTISTENPNQKRILVFLLMIFFSSQGQNALIGNNPHVENWELAKPNRKMDLSVLSPYSQPKSSEKKLLLTEQIIKKEALDGEKRARDIRRERWNVGKVLFCAHICVPKFIPFEPGFFIIEKNGFSLRIKQESKNRVFIPFSASHSVKPYPKNDRVLQIIHKKDSKSKILHLIVAKNAFERQFILGTILYFSKRGKTENINQNNK
ncbi:serine/threonine-protein phosphatase 1 regulatory subunit 10 [Anaeramoeba flamelloides]|uniref:Serine/threonine-protein phosphatase 1 regulatory subunit 10 n=1 Tax=Anaeramoeba flamelloides TaxID=1746091 RepID=A0ABQ8Y3M9_9EUKA|nr:serine/threonine-protein phosphatase 1 regulatory subunit 10 [Anaeramoeba flamelloides]